MDIATPFPKNQVSNKSSNTNKVIVCKKTKRQEIIINTIIYNYNCTKIV